MFQTLPSKFGVQKTSCPWPSQAHPQDQEGQQQETLSVPNFNAKFWSAKNFKKFVNYIQDESKKQT